MHISPRTARGYLDPIRLAESLAASLRDELPGVDLLGQPRDTSIPMPLLGRCVAGLAEAITLRIATEASPTAITNISNLAGCMSALGQFTLSNTAAARWVRMVQNHEQQTLDYVTGHLRDLDGERPGPAVPVTSFGVALASWTMQAIQRIADPHVPGADLQHIAHAENALLKTAAVLTAAAVERGELDTDTGRHLHRPAACRGGRLGNGQRPMGVGPHPGRGASHPRNHQRLRRVACRHRRDHPDSCHLDQPPRRRATP